MLSLPTEIWIHIFEHLCVHCQVPDHPHGIPDVTLADARAGKAALMALCLVSREVRAMSQGILFHYFLNLSQARKPWDPEMKGDRAPNFLRALILNPPLGRRVRMMSLFAHPFATLVSGKPDVTRKDLKSWTQVSDSFHIRVPSEVTRALAGLKCDNAPRLFFDEPGLMAQLRLSSGTSMVLFASETMQEVFRWLHALILNFVPHLTHLHLTDTESLGSLEQFQDSPPIFSQLQDLAYDSYRIENLVECQTLFPNLRRLGARDFWVGQPRQINSPIPAMNLRKLSISCLPTALSLILRLCPYLEDLECHVNPWGWNISQVAEVEWPAHVKSTLRRLAWSNRDYVDDLEYDPTAVSPCTVPLRDFECLEILEIDQVSLLQYTRSLGAKTVNSVLPRTIRILHIAFSRDVLSQLQVPRQLRAIAGARKVDLPNLSTVKVGDPPRRAAKKKLADFLKRTGVVPAMKDAGIELRIGKEASKNTLDRSILSQPPGGSNRNTGPVFQDEVFSLDDI